MRGGWFHTGDLARRDERGHHFFVDRKKDMVRRGGENIASQEVEHVLRAHPGVADAAGVGGPGPVWGGGVRGGPDPIGGEGVKACQLQMQKEWTQPKSN